MHGRVVDSATDEQVEGVIIDVWEASTNGLYEHQDPNQEDFNLCGKFKTDANGEYAFYCLKPTPYPNPFDGPAGKILQMLDRHSIRSVYIHLLVSTVFCCWATARRVRSPANGNRLHMMSTCRSPHRFSLPMTDT
jgi:catechol 1,2-dioxygenase